MNIFPLYDNYAQKTDREIPIVLLTPLDGPASARQGVQVGSAWHRGMSEAPGRRATD